MILDTNALSALFAGERPLEQILSTREKHQIPVIVVGEYLYGLAASRAGNRLLLLLQRLIAGSQVLEITLETASVYADVRRKLRSIGQPIPENDIWIAALCLQHHEPLVSRDAHFDAVAGLARIAW